MKIHTIGIGTRTPSVFLSLLKRFSINCIVDIRKEEETGGDAAYSKETIKPFLNNNGIYYLPFETEFGSYADVKQLNIKENFEKTTQEENFQKGMTRLQNGMAKGYHIALMGTEARPVECHRFTLLGRYLYLQGVEVVHILASGIPMGQYFLERDLPKIQAADFINIHQNKARQEHNQLGKWGEQVASSYLQANGYSILERNWRYKHREIDIIAYNPTKQLLSFVEVKTRRNDDFGPPELSVNRKKMWFLALAASHYLRCNNFMKCDAQFDIITIIGTPQTGYKLNHIPNAIPPSARSTFR